MGDTNWDNYMDDNISCWLRIMVHTLVNPGRYNWKQRILSEFGVSAKTLIQSYADSGYSKELTAPAIGICKQTLLKYCRENGIQFKDRIDLRPECKPKPGKYGIVNNKWGCKGRPK